MLVEVISNRPLYHYHSFLHLQREKLSYHQKTAEAKETEVPAMQMFFNLKPYYVKIQTQ